MVSQGVGGRVFWENGPISRLKTSGGQRSARYRVAQGRKEEIVGPVSAGRSAAHPRRRDIGYFSTRTIVNNKNQHDYSGQFYIR